MATLVAGVAVEADDLALYVVADGLLVNADAVECQIVTVGTSTLSGVEPFATRKAVSPLANVGIGRYALVDPDTGAAIAFETPIPKALIRWWVTVGGVTTYREAWFEVLSPVVTRSAAKNLFLVADAKAAGMTTFSDTAIFDLAKRWTARCEDFCRQPLSPRYASRKVSGEIGVGYFLAQELYGLESLVIAGRTVDNSLLSVFGAVNGHRGNPKIERAALQMSQFVPHDYNLKPAVVTGVWGVCDDLLVGPPADLSATVANVVYSVYGDDVGNYSVGPIKREKTDAHEIEYAVISSAVDTTMMSLLKSPELRDLLQKYRAPLLIGVGGQI